MGWIRLKNISRQKYLKEKIKVFEPCITSGNQASSLTPSLIHLALKQSSTWCFLTETMHERQSLVPRVCFTLLLSAARGKLSQNCKDHVVPLRTTEWFGVEGP